jgi:predicted transcriptional regulator
MASIASKTNIRSEPISELKLLRDIQIGLADVEAGRVIVHDEVRELLHQRYPG